MSAKKVIPIAIMVVIIAAASSVFLLEMKKTAASFCRACNREIHKDWAFTVTFKDGKKETLCCAKCGILEEMEKKSQVASVQATDFATGKPIPAEKAIYVWGSNMDHCPVPEKRDWTDVQPMRLAWDRCIPSLIAFENRDLAAKFQSEHGGRLVDYSDSVRLVMPVPTSQQN